jgi:murein L,D-transpeptidase YcbB/YkuD
MEKIFPQKNHYFTFLISFLLAFPFYTKAQENDTELLKTLIGQLCNDKGFAQQLEITEPEQLQKFYSQIDYQMAWSKQNTRFAEEFMAILTNANDYGMLKEDFHYNYLKSNHKNPIEKEVVCTHAMLSFLSEITSGKGKIDLDYNGLNYSNKCLNLEQLLASTYQKGYFSDILKYVQPQSMAYDANIRLLRKINVFLRDSSFNELPIEILPTLKENKNLIQKLSYLGFIANPADSESLHENNLIYALKGFQSLFNLTQDGKLGLQTLKKLNIPLKEIQSILIKNLHRWRNLNCLDNQRYILINIPSAELSFYDKDSLVTAMKVIVGKASTATPLISSKIDQIIFFPYWYVPNSIATKEILPVQQKEATFLENNGFQVLDELGNTIDPTTLPWATYTATNFPYRFRQVAGCDNSLGIVKFNFESPYAIYLHDTNHKELFSKSNRQISHGCVRLEKPYDLAAILLGSRSQVEDALKHRFDTDLKPQYIRLDSPVQVFITYMTTSVDEFGNLVIFEDVYRKMVKK